MCVYITYWTQQMVALAFHFQSLATNLCKLLWTFPRQIPCTIGCRFFFQTAWSTPAPTTEFTQNTLRETLSHGVPHAQVTENGRNFTAKSSEELLHGIGHRYLFTASSHLNQTALPKLCPHTENYNSFFVFRFVCWTWSQCGQLPHAHSITGSSPLYLFKSRILKTNSGCVQSGEVIILGKMSWDYQLV